MLCTVTVLERVRGLPGVQAAGVVDTLLDLGKISNLGLRSIEERTPEPRERWTPLKRLKGQKKKGGKLLMDLVKLAKIAISPALGKALLLPLPEAQEKSLQDSTTIEPEEYSASALEPYLR